MKARLQELVLIVIALVLCGLGWLLVHHGVQVEASTLPQNFWLVMGGSALAALVAHLAIRHTAPYADPLFFPAALLLTGLGLVMIHRIDYTLVAKGDAAEAPGQFRLAVVALVLMVVTVYFVKNHRMLRRITFISLILGTVLLLLPLLPGIGRSIYGASIWINVLGFSYQPAEMAKIFFAIFFAGYLVDQRDNLALAGKKILGIQLPPARHFGPILVAWLGCMGILAFERDFGTALLFFGMFVAALYVATERVSWMVIGAILSAVGVYLLVQVMPHIQARFTIWLHALDPEVYAARHGSWQIVQGWFGMASGGLFGTGLGQGYPRNTFAANSDLIVASFGEEIGLVGLLAIFSIYLLVVTRAIKAGLNLTDGLGKLLAGILGFTIGLQCFIVAGGVTGVIPLTGLAMPFMSLGGSALLTNWIIIGLLIRLSDAGQCNRNTPVPEPQVPARAPRQRDAQPVVAIDRQPTEVVR